MGGSPKIKAQPQPVIPPPPPPPVPVSYKREEESTASRRGDRQRSLGSQFLQRRKATPTGTAAFGQKKTLG